MKIGANIATGTNRSGASFLCHESSATSSYGRYSPSARDFVHSFYAVLNRWNSETAFMSNSRQKKAHPSFSAMVENAELVLPLIVSELQRKPSHLVWVLEEAFKEQPYSAEQEGDIPAMADAWVSWANNRGHD